MAVCFTTGDLDILVPEEHRASSNFFKGISLQIDWDFVEEILEDRIAAIEEAKLRAFVLLFSKEMLFQLSVTLY